MIPLLIALSGGRVGGTRFDPGSVRIVIDAEIGHLGEVVVVKRDCYTLDELLVGRVRVALSGSDRGREVVEIDRGDSTCENIVGDSTPLGSEQLVSTFG